MLPLQMDRFIPNRSASNLDTASYNIAMEMKDAENVQETSSPSKVSTTPAHNIKTCHSALLAQKNIRKILQKFSSPSLTPPSPLPPL